MDQSRIARSFARSQQSYGAQSLPQRVIAQALARRLAKAAGGRAFDRAFEFGHGSGHLSRALLRHFSISEFWLNDLTAPLPDLHPPDLHLPDLHQPDLHATALHPLPGPVEDLTLPNGLDLIASASTLQWIEPRATLLPRLAAQIRPGGWLALSSFGPAQFREIEALCPGARAPALCVPQALAACLPPGWQIHDLGEAHLRQRFESPRHLLRHLRETGVNGRAAKGWTRGDLARFSTRYETRFALPLGGVHLTWNPVWLIAQKRLNAVSAPIVNPAGSDAALRHWPPPAHRGDGSRP